MTTRLTPITTIALLLSGALLFSASAEAVTATASVTIISPTEVSIISAAELLKSASIGVLTLSIPGSGAFGSEDDKTVGEITLTSTGVLGNTIAFSTADSAPLASLIRTLAASGGSFGMTVILSTGQMVNLVITNAEEDSNVTGRVYAIVEYN